MEKIISAQPPLVQTHKTYGFITGLILVVLGALVIVMNLNAEKWVQWLMYIPFLGGLILNANAFSKANGGAVTFGQVFGSCFKAVAIVSLLMVVWALVSVYIFPEIKDNAIEIARAEMEKQGDLDAAMIERSLGMVQKNFTTFMVMGSLFGYLIIGLILSLIAAAIAPKNKPAIQKPL